MPETALTELDKQILEKGKEVHTESYSMSIGEVKNLYEDGDLDLHPEFQRFFRWTDEQKYRLIESILLGIPLPSFFVYQRPDGIWDIVDGLQRLSTIFQFMGILKDEEEQVMSPLIMEATKYLPGLKGMSWENVNTDFQISETVKRDFKRKKLDFNIILKHSDDTAKYELFERLNTGGSSASSQEVRNAILIRENKEVFKLLDSLSSNEDFINTTQMSETNLDERFDLELVTRFIILRNIDLAVFNSNTATDYLTDELIKRATDDNYDWRKEVADFNRTFEILNNVSQTETFKKFNSKKGRFEGGFIVSAFEVIALGVGYNLETINPDIVLNKIKEFWQAKDNGEIKWAGRNTTNRLQKTIQFGRNLFTA